MRETPGVRLDSWPLRILAILLIFAASAVAAYRVWPQFAAAWMTRGNPSDPAVYERAVQYDPGNADYHFILAQIYNYRTEHLNLERARTEYEAAVRLNPHRATHWIEMAKYYEQEGGLSASDGDRKAVEDRARNAMKKALEMDPNYAQTHWSAANLYLRTGDLPAADFELRRAADLDVMYLAPVLDLVWRFYEDPERIVTNHIPNTKASNLAALNYFVSKQSDSGAALAWRRLKAFETQPRERFAYVERLVKLNRPHEALEVFAYPGQPQPFFNGDFETETLNGGFDWRINSWPVAEARRDMTVYKHGYASLLINFTGKENLEYGAVWRWIPVTKGRTYYLTFWMKTDSVTTSEGIYLDVEGQSSEKLIGTNNWREYSIRFTPSSDLAILRVRRDVSKKFDNLLKGRVWLDNFDLTESRLPGNLAE